MADCEVLTKCPFFSGKLEKMPSTAELLKKRYCRDEYRSCARWMVRAAIGGDKVPGDLFPNQNERVARLIVG